MIIPLSEAVTGKKGRVVAFAGGMRFQERIVSMGLHIGCEVEVLQGNHSGNGPVRVGVGQTRLAIGHGMSDKVMLAMDPE